MKTFRRYLPFLLLISLLVIILWLGVYRYFNFEMFQEHYKTIEHWVTQFYPISILIFAMAYISIISLSIPIATFMTIIGGLLFGQTVGTLMVVLCATFGASLFFIGVKFASQKIVSYQTVSPWLKRMQQGFQKNAGLYLLTLRLIPIFPFAAINMAAAFFQIPLRTFFWGTLIGVIPAAFIYVSIGVALREVIQKPEFSARFIFNPKVVVMLFAGGILLLLPILYKYYQDRHKDK